jgi:hypothetical protein
MTYNPGDFSFIANNTDRMMYEDMFTAVSKACAWEEMKADPGTGGYMFGAQDLVSRISGHLTDRVGHSGASFAYTMRVMQAIARYGWPYFVASHRQS